MNSKLPGLAAPERVRVASTPMRGAYATVRQHWRGPEEIALCGVALLAYFGVRALTQREVQHAVANAPGHLR